ncbi:MAG: serine/threonine-protein kinase [Anaerolineae bacterium]
MRCFNCGEDGLPVAADTCPKCRAYLPALLRDVLPPDTALAGGKYRLEYALGRGGFGVTYRGRHVALEQPVAIKEFFPRELALRNAGNGSVVVSGDTRDAYDEAFARFIREGQILVRLRHPHVVRVQDLFTERGTAYLVMELLDGRTLRDELSLSPMGRVPADRVREIVGQMVDALQAVHHQGVYHLDLKPENVVITAAREVVLIDFGAARLGFQRHSAQPFTLRYAAPEVLCVEDVGAETDLFELGMMLYELLVGEPPTPALSRLVKDTWAPQRLGSPWDDLIAAALKLSRAARPSSVADWWARGARPPALAGRRGLTTAPAKPAQRALRGHVGSVRYLAFTSDGSMLISGGADGAVRLWDVSGGREIDARIEGNVPVTCYSFDSQQALAVGGRRDGSLVLWNAKLDGRPRLSLAKMSRVLPSEASIACVTFAPDGRQLALGGMDDAVKLWDVSTLRELRKWAAASFRVLTLSFAPGGYYVASGGQNGAVSVWSTRTGRVHRAFEGHANASVFSVAFRPDGHLLASGGSDRAVRLWETDTGAQRLPAMTHPRAVRAVTFNRDGLLASAGAGGVLRVWDPTDGTIVLERTAPSTILSLAFGPDGHTLAAGCENGAVLLDTI